MIAQALLVHESTISRHLTDVINEQKLMPKDGRALSHLNSEQTKTLIEHLSDMTYFHTHQICRYITLTFDIVLPDVGATLNGRINDNFQTFYPAT